MRSRQPPAPSASWQMAAIFSSIIRSEQVLAQYSNLASVTGRSTVAAVQAPRGDMLPDAAAVFSFWADSACSAGAGRREVPRRIPALMSLSMQHAVPGVLQRSELVIGEDGSNLPRELADVILISDWMPSSRSTWRRGCDAQ